MDALLDYGARGVFLSTFAMLFGIGFALQIERLDRAGDVRGPRVYLRRMGALLLLGLLHTLLDPAEVLVLYALCGVLLLLFRRVPLRGVLLAAALLLPVPYLHTAVVTTRAAASPVVEASAADDDPLAWDPYRSAESIRVHSEGDLGDVVRFNARFTVARLTPSLASYVWLTVPLPLMLFGMFLGRLGIVRDIESHQRSIERFWWMGLLAGITGRAVGQSLLGLAGRGAWNPWIDMAGQVTWVLGAFSLALAYGSAVLLLLQRRRWRRILQPLRHVGRTALTNYLLQTVACTTLFYPYGAGLFGDVSSSTAAAFAVGIFACQLAASALWLRRYRFGPVEWLWRTLTYGVAVPNRRPTGGA